MATHSSILAQRIPCTEDMDKESDMTEQLILSLFTTMTSSPLQNTGLSLQPLSLGNLGKSLPFLGCQCHPAQNENTVEELSVPI